MLSGRDRVRPPRSVSHPDSHADWKTLPASAVRSAWELTRRLAVLLLAAGRKTYRVIARFTPVAAHAIGRGAKRLGALLLLGARKTYRVVARFTPVVAYAIGRGAKRFGVLLLLGGRKTYRAIVGWVPVAQRIWKLAAQGFSRLPRKVRMGIATGVLFLLSLPFLLSLWAPPSTTLEVQSEHSFLSAELSLRVDDDLVYEGGLAGVEKRRFFRKTVQGSFSESLRVPAGERVVRVRVHSDSEGYDQTSETTVEFQENQTQRLVIQFRGRRNLNLSWTE